MKGKRKARVKPWDDVRRLGNGHAGIVKGYTHMCIHVVNADSGQRCGKMLELRFNRKECQWITTIGVAHMKIHPASNVGQGSLHRASQEQNRNVDDL